MTEKRFQINNNMSLEDKVETFELSCVVDTDNKTFYFIVDDLANVEAFIERLNELNDENKQLRSEYKVLYTQYRDLQKFMENNFDEHSTQQKLNRQIIKLFDENEQLKKRVEYLERKIQRERVSAIKEHEKWEKEIQKENEQLKKDIEYYKTERLALFEYLDKKDDLKLELKVKK